VLAAVAALSSAGPAPARAEAPDSRTLALLDRRLEHSSSARVLTLAGLVEMTGARATAEGVTYRSIVASTSSGALPAAGTVAWDAVLGVDVQRTMAGTVALRTGITLGAVGLLIGFAGGV